jgi:hypothetical protein
MLKIKELLVINLKFLNFLFDALSVFGADED